MATMTQEITAYNESIRAAIDGVSVAIERKTMHVEALGQLECVATCCRTSDTM